METHIHRCSEPSCSFFNQILPHNAKVCPMCGTALKKAIDISSTEGLVRPSFPPALSVQRSSCSSFDSERVDRPQLKFLHRSGQSFVLIRGAGTIGRQNMVNGARPEIDLTSLPHSEVISRTHAHVFWDNDQRTYMIIDDSRNGTYLNGELMARGAPHRLYLGDELQLGQDQLIRLEVDLSPVEAHTIYHESVS